MRRSLTREQRIQLAEAALAENRIVQNSWRLVVEGRELVCALAAFGPDDIGRLRTPKACPADLMPEWVAGLIPVMDDCIRTDMVDWFMAELIARVKRWHILDEAAWSRIASEVVKRFGLPSSVDQTSLIGYQAARALSSSLPKQMGEQAEIKIDQFFALVDAELDRAESAAKPMDLDQFGLKDGLNMPSAAPQPQPRQSGKRQRIQTT